MKYDEDSGWWWKTPATGRKPSFDQSAAMLAWLEEDTARWGPMVRTEPAYEAPEVDS